MARLPCAISLDGDARKQYEAIYNYLLPGRKVDPPEN